jgi:hypothetical protein
MSEKLYNNGLKLLFFEAISDAKKNQLTEISLVDISKNIAIKENLKKSDYPIYYKRVYQLAKSLKNSGLIMMETKIIAKKQICIIHI